MGSNKRKRDGDGERQESAAQPAGGQSAEPQSAVSRGTRSTVVSIEGEAQKRANVLSRRGLRAQIGGCAGPDGVTVQRCTLLAPDGAVVAVADAAEPEDALAAAMMRLVVSEGGFVERTGPDGSVGLVAADGSVIDSQVAATPEEARRLLARRVSLLLRKPAAC